MAHSQAQSCTLKDAQQQFSILSELFHIYRNEALVLVNENKNIPENLKAKQQELSKTTADIRKLFAKDIEKKSHLAADDPVNPIICNRYNLLMQSHASALKNRPSVKVTVLLPQIEPEKAKEPACEEENIRKRFGDAVRKKRQLTIAGKITRKEQISYLEIATRFVENARNDTIEACHNLHEFEQQLAGEKADQPEG